MVLQLMHRHALQQEQLQQFTAACEGRQQLECLKRSFHAWQHLARARRRAAEAAALLQQLREETGPQLLLLGCLRSWCQAVQQQRRWRTATAVLQLLQQRHLFAEWRRVLDEVRDEQQLQQQALLLQRQWKMRRVLLLLHEKQQEEEWKAWCIVRAENFLGLLQERQVLRTCCCCWKCAATADAFVAATDLAATGAPDDANAL